MANVGVLLAPSGIIFLCRPASIARKTSDVSILIIVVITRKMAVESIGSLVELCRILKGDSSSALAKRLLVEKIAARGERQAGKQQGTDIYMIAFHNV